MRGKGFDLPWKRSHVDGSLGQGRVRGTPEKEEHILRTEGSVENARFPVPRTGKENPRKMGVHVKGRDCPSVLSLLFLVEWST